MDPLTAALLLATEIAKLIHVAIESQPPDVRAEFAKMHLEDMQKWRAFLERFRLPKEAAPVRKTPKRRRSRVK
jgi:hypothetical protein